MTPHPAAAVAAALVLTTALSASGSSGGSSAGPLRPTVSRSTTFSGAATAAAPAAAPVPQIARKSAAGTTAPALGIPDSALGGRSVSYTAEETLKVEDVAKAVSSIEAAVAAAGGLVANSDRSGDGDTASANLVLKVPPGGFNPLLDRLGKLGAVMDRNLSGTDLTEAVVDVAGRVDSRRKSVDRVRALMAQATNLRDVVALEGELADREAELEAVPAKQQKLAQEVDPATVTVHLQTEQHPAPPAPHHSRATGFLAGFGNGWGALTGALTAAATVFGVLAPFVLPAAVLAWPAVLLVRRLRRTNNPTPS